jgi:hypothetical protein
MVKRTIVFLGGNNDEREGAINYVDVNRGFCQMLR